MFWVGYYAADWLLCLVTWRGLFLSLGIVFVVWVLVLGLTWV